ncbi:MAG TPA: CE1759 family FMN reductase [Solirubrobacteraceae bacterium]
MSGDTSGQSRESEPTTARLVVVSAGTEEPSSSRLLADRIANSCVGLLHELRWDAPLAVDVARASVTGLSSSDLQSAIDRVGGADAIIASTPVYKAGLSGLFKSFVDVLDGDLLIAKPVLLAATARSSRHALVVDEQMRPLFAFMRALVLPTSVFAAPEDWGSTNLGERIRRAAAELAALVTARLEQRIADLAWSGYQHEFAGNATRAQQTAADIDFDSPLMRLAAGGSITPGEPPPGD